MNFHDIYFPSELPQCPESYRWPHTAAALRWRVGDTSSAITWQRQAHDIFHRREGFLNNELMLQPWTTFTKSQEDLLCLFILSFSIMIQHQDYKTSFFNAWMSFKEGFVGAAKHRWIFWMVPSMEFHSTFALTILNHLLPSLLVKCWQQPRKQRSSPAVTLDV